MDNPAPARTLVMNAMSKPQPNSWMHPRVQRQPGAGLAEGDPVPTLQETRIGSTTSTNHATLNPHFPMTGVSETSPVAMSTATGKRRLGMGRATAVGYNNKKFKTQA